MSSNSVLSACDCVQFIAGTEKGSVADFREFCKHICSIFDIRDTSVTTQADVTIDSVNLLFSRLHRDMWSLCLIGSNGLYTSKVMKFALSGKFGDRKFLLGSSFDAITPRFPSNLPVSISVPGDGGFPVHCTTAKGVRSGEFVEHLCSSFVVVPALHVVGNFEDLFNSPVVEVTCHKMIFPKDAKVSDYYDNYSVNQIMSAILRRVDMSYVDFVDLPIRDGLTVAQYVLRYMQKIVVDDLRNL